MIGNEHAKKLLIHVRYWVVNLPTESTQSEYEEECEYM